MSQKDSGAQLEFESRISYFGNVVQLNQSSWLLETNQNPGQVLNHFEDYYDSDDQVFVFKLSPQWEASAQFDRLTWLEENLGE